MLSQCASSNTSIQITSTKQFTTLASMWAATSSLPTMVPRYPFMDQSMDPSPGSPSATPCQINSSWYVADTSSPAILGLLSCKRLKVLKMNCTDTAIQNTPKPLSSAPAPTTPPLQKNTSPIRSTDDLIQKFTDGFQGVDHFPNEYTIRVCDDVHSATPAPWKCPISMNPKNKAELDQMAVLSNITHTDVHIDLVSSATYTWKKSGELCLHLDPHGLYKAIFGTKTETYHGRSNSQVCTLSLPHKGGCPSWVMDHSPRPWVQPAYYIHQSFWLISLLTPSLWPHLLPRYFPEEDASNTGRMCRLHWDHWWHHCPWLY